MPNRCALRGIACRHSHVCDNQDCRRKPCGHCGKCNAVCPDFREGECRRLKQAPYVCNWCVDYSKCTLKKRMHFSSGAHENYRQTLRKAHSGTHLSWETPCTMDRLLREHLSGGQSIHHIMAHSTDLIPVGGKTVYRLIANGLMPFVRRMDLPEAAGRKRKSSLPEKGRRHADLRRGDRRSCQDFLRHMEGHSTASVVEMDSVIGRVWEGGKCLPTLNFNFCGMMPVFLRERNDAQSVVECLDWLEGRLGPETFRELLQVVLTDNGGEFTLVDRMEAGKDGSRRIGRLFFCNPYSSWQKGRVENNHRILRRVLPRGTSFDSLDQDRVNLPVPHVNSMPRAEYNDVPALETFGKTVGEETLQRLGIRPVPPGQVVLAPKPLGL